MGCSLVPFKGESPFREEGYGDGVEPRLLACDAWRASSRRGVNYKFSLFPVKKKVYIRICESDMPISVPPWHARNRLRESRLVAGLPRGPWPVRHHAKLFRPTLVGREGSRSLTAFALARWPCVRFGSIRRTLNFSSAKLRFRGLCVRWPRV